MDVTIEASTAQVSIVSLHVGLLAPCLHTHTVAPITEVLVSMVTALTGARTTRGPGSYLIAV